MFLPIFLFLFACSLQCDVDKENVLINSGDTTITITKSESVYFIYYMQKGLNVTSLVYSSPIEGNLYLTYDSVFKINFKNATLVDGIGKVTLSPLLQMFLKPINRGPVEAFKICLDFSTERLVMKIIVGVLGILLLVSHGAAARDITQTISGNLLRSEFAGRFPGLRSLVSGSKEDNSGPHKETSI